VCYNTVGPDPLWVLDRGRNVHFASRFFPERHAPEAWSFVVALAV
jgi:hypothetical protein